MSQIFSKNRRTKKNLKTPKEIIWENEEKNSSTTNLFYFMANLRLSLKNFTIC